MQHHAADDAYQYEAHAAEDKVCARAQPYETCAEGLIARRRQEMESAIRERLDVERGHILSVLERRRWCWAVYVVHLLGRVGGGVARTRGGRNGVGHGGCVGANIGVWRAKGEVSHDLEG
jgi:hypothetical protein